MKIKLCSCYLVIKTQLSSLEVHITVELQNATRIIIIIIKKQQCISAIFVDQQMDLQYPKLINKNTQGPGHVVDWSESSKFIWQWCWQPSLCEEDMKRNARKEKNLFFLASKLNSHSMLQLSLFPALHKQASNQFHLYLQEEREREREHARMITDPANNKIPFTTPFFPPAHSTEEQIPISRKEWQEQHEWHPHQKKKMGDQTENNLQRNTKCVVVFSIKRSKTCRLLPRTIETY